MAQERFLTASTLMNRYSVCRRTIGRWLKRSDLDFPKPIRLNGRRYWLESEITGWDAKRQTER